MLKGYAKPTKKKSAVKKGYRGKGDLGKPNVPGKTGFAAVSAKGAAEYGSKEAGEKVAGAVLKKLRGGK